MAFSSDVPGGSLLVPPDQFPEPAVDVPATPGTDQVAVLAGGCFWCVEAVYRQLAGVNDVVSGYAGDSADTADYETVCSGSTDHAEAVLIRFDSEKISYGQLLRVFFSVAHDPTQRDRQGPDSGRQYRSAIFYADEQQKRVAQSYIEQLDQAKVLAARIVTEVVPLEGFYKAEDYHQNYAFENPGQPYIAYHATPKVLKLRKYFSSRLGGAS